MEGKRLQMGRACQGACTWALLDYESNNQGELKAQDPGSVAEPGFWAAGRICADRPARTGSSGGNRQKCWETT